MTSSDVSDQCKTRTEFAVPEIGILGGVGFGATKHSFPPLYLLNILSSTIFLRQTAC